MSEIIQEWQKKGKKKRPGEVRGDKEAEGRAVLSAVQSWILL